MKTFQSPTKHDAGLPDSIMPSKMHGHHRNEENFCNAEAETGTTTIVNLPATQSQAIKPRMKHDSQCHQRKNKFFIRERKIRKRTKG